MSSTNPITSYTRETVGQKLAAMVIASAINARLRIEAGKPSGVEIARINLCKN